jgi:hypothetical protein
MRRSLKVAVCSHRDAVRVYTFGDQKGLSFCSMKLSNVYNIYLYGFCIAINIFTKSMLIHSNINPSVELWLNNVPFEL